MGNIRVLEKRILTRAALERVLEAPGPWESVKILTQSSEYDFGGLTRAADYEPILQGELQRVYRLLYKLTPARETVDVLTLKYDYHNIKAALKGKYSGTDPSRAMVNVTDLAPDSVRKAAEAREGAADLVPAPIAEALAEGAAAYERDGSPGAIDFALDKRMLAETLNLAVKIGSKLITDYTRTSIDFYNLKTMLRTRALDMPAKFLKSALATGGKLETNIYLEFFDKSLGAIGAAFWYKYLGGTVRDALSECERAGSYAPLEKKMDGYLLGLASQAKYIAFGPELLFAYGCAKEHEIRQIRTILTGKLNNIPYEAIKERLCEAYA
jgi:V/A-type H+-transporting ATPase subunit C